MSERIKNSQFLNEPLTRKRFLKGALAAAGITTVGLATGSFRKPSLERITGSGSSEKEFIAGKTAVRVGKDGAITLFAKNNEGKWDTTGTLQVQTKKEQAFSAPFTSSENAKVKLPGVNQDPVIMIENEQEQTITSVLLDEHNASFLITAQQQNGRPLEVIFTPPLGALDTVVKDTGEETTAQEIAQTGSVATSHMLNSDPLQPGTSIELQGSQSKNKAIISVESSTNAQGDYISATVSPTEQGRLFIDRVTFNCESSVCSFSLAAV